METISFVILIGVILWILKSFSKSSDNIWKNAKKVGVKKTNSSYRNCEYCQYGNKTITTREGKDTIYGIHCEIKDITVTSNIICNNFKEIPTNQHKQSLFGS